MLSGEKQAADLANNWEESVIAVLREQNAIQADITECLGAGDLIGAASASFEHVLTSYALGDRAEAYGYMMTGIMFAHAELFLEGQQGNVGETRFKLPSCLEKTTQTDLNQNDLTLDQRAAKSVLVAEAVINSGGSEPDAKDVNSAIFTAVAAVCALASEKESSSGDPQNLMTLVKQMTRQLILNWDKESTIIALDALNCFKAYLIAYDDGGLSPRRSVLKSIREIMKGPLSGDLGSACRASIAELNELRTAKVIKRPAAELGGAILDTLCVANGSNPPVSRHIESRTLGPVRNKSRNNLDRIVAQANF